MSRPEPSRTTITSANQMTEEEREAFLRRKYVARLGTNRRDGWPHVTPVWPLYEDGKFYVILGVTRVHLKNLERDPKATLCIDEDARLEHGFGAGAQGVVARCSVELRRDPEIFAFVYPRMARRYELEDDETYTSARDSEPRVIAVLTPESWATWDFTKA